MNMRVVERRSLVLKQLFYVVNERRHRAQHVDVLPVDILRHVDLIPELGKVRHLQWHALVGNRCTEADDGLSETLLVDGHPDEQVHQQVIRLVKLPHRCVVRCIYTLPPHTCYSLPESVRSSPSLQVFRSRLKTELFAWSYSHD